MEKIKTITLQASFLLTTFSIALAYEVFDLNDQTPYVRIFALAAQVLLIPLGVQVVVQWLSSIPAFRRHVLGSCWVEGTWVFLDYNREGFIAPGIASIAYEDDGDLHTSVARLRQNNSITSSVSKRVTLDKFRSYSNVFESHANSHRVSGIAVGKFIYDSNRKLSTMYDGQVFFYDGSEPHTQVGYRLPEAFVAWWVAREGVTWKVALLSAVTKTTQADVGEFDPTRFIEACGYSSGQKRGVR